MSRPWPLLIAHRGGHAAAGENTAAAFAHAVALGVDMLECDVRRTADGVLVLAHDADVTADGRKCAVSKLDLATLRRINPALLTFDSFLEQFGQGAALNVDLKATGYEREVVEALQRHGVVARTLVSTQHVWSLRRVAALEPGLGRGLSRGHLASSVPTAPLKRFTACWLRLTFPPILLPSLRLAHATAVMFQHRMITQRIVRLFHARGYHVFTWTVDDDAEAGRVVAAGVDGIATNVPERIAHRVRHSV